MIISFIKIEGRVVEDRAGIYNEGRHFGFWGWVWLLAQQLGLIYNGQKELRFKLDLFVNLSLLATIPNHSVSKKPHPRTLS